MKKMFTLLLATGLVTVAIAQVYHGNYARADSRYPSKVVVVDHRYDNRPLINLRERDAQVARINQEIDFKISSVNHRWFMSRAKKDWEIRNLEMQRQQKIGDVFARFGGRPDFHNSGFVKNGRY